MAITAFITRHSTDAKKWPRMSNGEALGTLGGQDDIALDLDLTDGTAHDIGPTDATALYRIKIDGADVRLRIGKDAVADESGEKWFDGDTEVRLVHAGETISIKAG